MCEERPSLVEGVEQSRLVLYTSSPPTTARPIRPLGQNITEQRILLVFVNVMNPHMPRLLC